MHKHDLLSTAAVNHAVVSSALDLIKKPAQLEV